MPPSVVTPGNHDGVHLGHQALVQAAKHRAARDGWTTVAMFFDPHPTAVLAPERAPRLLTTPARRVELLRAAGVDRTVTMPFSEAFARTPPRTFVEQVLLAECNARAVVVGPDFHFGHKRSGNIDTLRELGEEYGYEVIVVPPVMVGDEPSSSTRVRRLLREGDVGMAAELLARVHDVDGVVVHGDARGRTIGFPTANLDVGDAFVPKDGVYAAVVRRLSTPDAPMLHGVLNVGTRPTVGRGRSFEVFLFDFDADLYGETLRVGFVSRLRDVARFDGLDALRAQLLLDSTAAREACAHADKEKLRWL